MPQLATGKGKEAMEPPINTPPYVTCHAVCSLRPRNVMLDHDILAVVTMVVGAVVLTRR